MIDTWRGKAGSADYRNSSPRMRAVMSRCVNEDLRGVMPAIKPRHCWCGGEKDTATRSPTLAGWRKLIPDAGLVSFPGCGHYSFLDNPIGFRAVLAENFSKRNLTQNKLRNNHPNLKKT